MIALPALGDLEDRLWLALMDIADRRAGDWTLVGGQIVRRGGPHAATGRDREAFRVAVRTDPDLHRLQRRLDEIAERPESEPG